jgi:site-specific DNA-methyltransferase (adenine-specific)
VDPEPVSTTHRLVVGDVRAADLKPGSVDLVVTSPPYPMVEMWDESFASQSPRVRQALDLGDAPAAFEAMHAVLDDVWRGCERALAPGGFLCVNIGDATRTVVGRFRLHANHVRVADALERLGLTPLPPVLWRKATNAPTKFMGSGMLPAGAYVTLEHEHILVFRKGDRRGFPSPAERAARAQSAYFWEERNQWFSDAWAIPGARQTGADAAVVRRSAAFPLEVPYRLVMMFSVYGDSVLDPFGGLGTTGLAAMAAARRSVLCDVDPSLVEAARRRLLDSWESAAARARRRLEDHAAFVAARTAPLAHTNRAYGFPVTTRQERDLVVLETVGVSDAGRGGVAASHGVSAPRVQAANPNGFHQGTTP